MILHKNSIYFTFGGSSGFRNYYVEIRGFRDPRVAMFAHFGPKWAFERNYETFKELPKRYGLKRLVLIEPRVKKTYEVTLGGD